MAVRRGALIFSLTAAALCAVTLQGCGGDSSPTPAPTPPVHSVKLSNGVDMPLLSAGTWLYNESMAESSVIDALSVGFRHIDTAYDYRNQRGVARGIKKSGLDRSAVFITTKIPGCGLQNVSAVDVEHCRNDTIKRLQDDFEQLDVPYIDLILIHFPPCPGEDGTNQVTSKSTCFAARSGCSNPKSADMIKAQWGVLEDLYSKHKVRGIGVSNYCRDCLAVLDNAKTKPMVNQVQYHAGMGPDPQGFKTRANQFGMVLQAWSPLGSGGQGSSKILKGNLTTSIGKKHGKSPVQVALKWILSNGLSLTTKSSNREHLKENLEIFDFELDKEDMAALDKATFASQDTPSFLCNDAVVESQSEQLVV